MSGLAKKRKREEEMEGEIGDLATENALLKAEIDKLKLENQNLKEDGANEKVKVSQLESRKKDLISLVSHLKGQKTKAEVDKAKTSLNKGSKGDWMSASFKTWMASDLRNRQTHFSKTSRRYCISAGQVMPSFRR